MAQLITDNKEVIKLQEQFQKRLEKAFPEKVNCVVGYPGGSIKQLVHYNKELGVWCAFKKNNNRYWNAFGTQEPKEKKNLSIDVEINFPLNNPDATIAGTFVKNGKNEILVCHRGKIGGGTKGVGKTLFLDHFSGDQLVADSNGEEIPLALVGDIRSSLLGQQVAIFVKEVARIKQIGRKQIPILPDSNELKFFDESFGSHTVTSKRSYTVNRIHGIVVGVLKEELKRRGYKYGNDRNRDLRAYKKASNQILFEVKTATTSQDIYKAVGQLLIYSIPLPKSTRLVFVAPGNLPPTVKQKLQSLDIEHLEYSWKDDKPVFKQLSNFI